MLSILKASCQLLAFTSSAVKLTSAASIGGLDLFGRQSVDQGIVGGLVIGVNQACPANATKCDSSELSNLRSICCPSLTTYCYRKTISNETWPYCCLNGMDCSKVGATNEVCGDPDWVPCFTPNQYKCCQPNQVCTYDFGEGCYDTLPTVSTESLLSYTSRLATSTRTSTQSTTTTADAITTPDGGTTSAAPVAVKNGLSSGTVGGIAGGVAAGVILIAVALGVGIWLGRRRRRTAVANNLLNPAPSVAQNYSPQHYDLYQSKVPGTATIDAPYANQPVISELPSRTLNTPHVISELE